MHVHPWREAEITLTAARDYPNLRSGEVVGVGSLDTPWAHPNLPASMADGWIPDEGSGPRVYICCDEFD